MNDFEAVATKEDADSSQSLAISWQRRRHWRSLVTITILILASQVLVSVAVFKITSRPQVITYKHHTRSGLLSRTLILFGLKEGYGLDGIVHELTEAQNIIDQWMQQRRLRNETIISGALRSETLIYPHDDNAKNEVVMEPAAVFAGIVRDDDSMGTLEVLDTLRNLTEAICVPLRQVLCFYEYLNVEYQWENKELNN